MGKLQHGGMEKPAAQLTNKGEGRLEEIADPMDIELDSKADYGQNCRHGETRRFGHGDTAMTAR